MAEPSSTLAVRAPRDPCFAVSRPVAIRVMLARIRFHKEATWCIKFREKFNGSPIFHGIELEFTALKRRDRFS